MCLGVPGRVTAIHGRDGEVDIMGVVRKVSLALLQDVKIGDYILMHAGCGIQILDEEEAEKTLEIFKELKEYMHEN